MSIYFMAYKSSDIYMTITVLGLLLPDNVHVSDDILLRSPKT
jgi:hypothetical protein